MVWNQTGEINDTNEQDEEKKHESKEKKSHKSDNIYFYVSFATGHTATFANKMLHKLQTNAMRMEMVVCVLLSFSANVTNKKPNKI